MIGKDIAQLEASLRPAERLETDPRPETFLELRKLGREGSIAPMDMTIGKGEIVGLAGLLGSGRTETARLLFVRLRQRLQPALDLGAIGVE
jgi:simple sugar transport system ATP-binding protein